MKNILLFIFVSPYFGSLHAQYYYKDIIGTRELNQMIRLYLDNKVSKVEAAGFDGEGAKNSDFSETQDVFKGGKVFKIATRNKTSTTNQYYRLDDNGYLSSISDTSSAGISTTTYSYDNKSNPVIIKNTLTDADDSIYENEIHQWFYNAQGNPVRMLRIVNNTDTTDTRFTLDDRGNVVEELPFIKKLSRDKTYYYYDSKNRLTDIVRYNVKARRLLPDYMFEYSEKNQVIQKITTLSTIGLGYLIWRYVFDERGLKIKEATFNRDKVMTGKIEYSYQFAQ